MQLTLFQRVLQKLVGIRALSPEHDAERYAEQLLAARPGLFSRLDGGVDGRLAQDTALEIARDHVREVCRLPELSEALQRSVGAAALSPGDRLVRITGLAYLTCERDLIPDDLPAGFGLIDDCITFHGSALVTQQPMNATVRERTRRLIRYLAIAVDDEVRRQIEAALVHAAEIARACDALPSSTVEAAILAIIAEPPAEFPINLTLPKHPPLSAETRSLLSLPAAWILAADEDGIVIEFADGERMTRRGDGSLSSAASSAGE
ncbi:MAG: hypothetical protein KC431_18955 [Myxococcales bacterium]|nr:hypothetical protein [Myxococcales bacterium]